MPWQNETPSMFTLGQMRTLLAITSLSENLYRSVTPMTTSSSQTPGKANRTGTADRNAVEFWDAAANPASVRPAKRATLIFIGTLSICAMLITSAAAFATIYIL
jgi:hypothetical protein